MDTLHNEMRAPAASAAANGLAELGEGAVVAKRFKIIQKLGQGGMGAVYLAERLGIGQKVALKFLKTTGNLVTDSTTSQRFFSEAKSYAQVTHPNAVVLHDVEHDEQGQLFLVMEFCEGQSLKRVLYERGALPVADAVDIVLQVADVLAQAHSKSIVHLDLKPENIMVRPGLSGWHVKVLDFGLAQILGQAVAAAPSDSGMIAGTPRYMAPEQVSGGDVDARADIYSLGLILFELLTGQHPFRGMTVTEVLCQQLAAPTPDLVGVGAPLTSAPLNAVVQRATAKNRDERYPCVADLARGLKEAASTMVPHLGRAAPFMEDHTTLVDNKALLPSGEPVAGQAGAVGGATELLLTQQASPTLLGVGGPSGASSPTIAVRVGRRNRVPRWLLLVLPLSLALVVVAVLLERQPETALLMEAAAPLAYEDRGERRSEDSAAVVVDDVEALAQVVGNRVVGLVRQEENSRMASEMLAKADYEFKHENFAGALRLLAQVPRALPPDLRAQHVALQDEVSRVALQLQQARAHYAKGDCAAASEIYRDILRRHDMKGVREAMAQCRRADIPLNLD